MYKKTLLKNGLRIITHRMPSRLTTSLGIWIGVGGRYENKENKGMAHFLEHLTFKGSKNYSNKAIKESIEGIGGSLNGFTTEELTCYLAKVPFRYFDLTLKIIADIVLNPTLASGDVEKERQVIAEEIRMYNDLPQHIVQDKLDQLMWPRHPLGMNIAGTINSINRITREWIADFHNDYYIPSNIVVAACGNLEHEKVVSLSKRLFKDNRPKDILGFKKINSIQSRPQTEFISKDTQQTHVAIGFPGLNRAHPDRYILGILNVILGANMSSRLFHEVREKRGLAYAISSHVKNFQDAGAFVIHAGTDNIKFIETIKVALEQLKKIKKQKVEKSELKRAKDYFIGQIVMSLEDNLEHMLWIGESTMSLNKTFSFKQILDEVNRINTQDIFNMANKIFKSDKISLAVVGPSAGKSQKQIKNILNLN